MAFARLQRIPDLKNLADYIADQSLIHLILSFLW